MSFGANYLGYLYPSTVRSLTKPRGALYVSQFVYKHTARCSLAVSIGKQPKVNRTLVLVFQLAQHTENPTAFSHVESMQKYFEQFGEVAACTIMKDPHSGRSRGFGFLTFADPVAVNTVMVKEHFLDGKIVRNIQMPSSKRS